MPAVDLTDDNRIIVVNLNTSSVGILVDSMSEVLIVRNNTIEALPSFMSDTQSEQLNGVAKLKDGKRLIMIMDVEKVLSINEFNQMQSEAEAPDGNAEGLIESGGTIWLEYQPGAGNHLVDGHYPCSQCADLH